MSLLKSFPVERQLDRMDCGPTCLKIVSKHYKKFYSLQLLRDLCGVSRDGASILDLSHAAEKIGFRSHAFKTDMNGLISKASLPIICHWRKNHFVVVYKITKNKIFISDPAQGLMSFTHHEFRDQWMDKEQQTGYLMALEPGPNFQIITESAKADRRKSWNSIMGYFRPYQTSFVNLMVIMLVVTILQGLLPFISKAVIDVGIQTQDIKFIDIVLFGNIAIIISVALSNIVRDWILLHLTSRLNISLISDYLGKVMRLPITFFENRLVGDILQRANDHERIRSFLMNNSLSTIFSSLTFLVFSIVLLIYNHTIFYIFITGNTLYVLWVYLFMRARKKVDWEYFELVSQNQSYWVETVNAIQDIKLNNYEQKKRWMWESIQAKIYKVNLKVLSINSAQSIGAQTVSNLTNLLIVFVCARGVISGSITFGVMISTQFITGMLSGPVNQFIQFAQSYQYAKISFLRLNEIHSIEDEEDLEKSNNVIFPDSKTLTLKNVSFSYGPNLPLILRNINLTIPAGKVTAIVGDSGSGKTTLLKILLRLYKPSFGDVLIGNMNISNFNLREWRNRVGAVMQDGKILNDTILKNITLNDDRIDYGKLKRSVRIANISEEIESLPLGYNTVMGEMGRGLSGGQKQRILIARAIYKNPDFLFLDEATNSLDSINEQKIITALEKVFEHKTVVVIAHRLSTIQKADQIIVMKGGQIVEIGNHELLIKRKGHYANLIGSQFSSQEINNF